jgi:predicted transposase/invertase (TIGR01784 family)
LARLLDTEQVALVKGSFVDKRLRQHFSDLLFRVGLRAGGEAFIYILLEHKSEPDALVARQLLRYLSLIWERLEVDGKLSPIIPVGDCVKCCESNFQLPLSPAACALLP